MARLASKTNRAGESMRGSMQQNIIVASQTKNHNGKIFSSRREANQHGYYTAGQLRRRGRKPLGHSTANLATIQLASDEQRELFSNWGIFHWLDSTNYLATGTKLYHEDTETRPYNPSAKTKAIWAYQELFVSNWKKYDRAVAGGWHTAKTDSYRYGLNETEIGQFVTGRQIFKVYSGRFTNFVGFRVENNQPLEVVQKSVNNAAGIQRQLSARKWFVQLGRDGLQVFFVFGGRNKTSRAVARLARLLADLDLPAKVYPNDDEGFVLPLAKGSRVFADRELTLVEGRKVGGVAQLEADVVGLVGWINAPSAGNPNAETILDAYRPKEEGEEKSTKKDLLYIAVQTDNEDTNSLKNRCWKVVTDFWLGRNKQNLNKMLVVTARIFYLGGLSEADSKQIIGDFCQQLPQDYSSRLKPEKLPQLQKDISKTVRKVYQDNGGQSDSELSTRKLQASVAHWRSKGLLLWDRETWGLTYGAYSLPDFELTEQEQNNALAYVGPILSVRDLKGRDRGEVVELLTQSLLKLVASKEREERALSTDYLKKYLQGEVGVNVQNQTKFLKLKKAYLDLGFVKVIKQGRKRAGATRYGLAGRLATLLGGESQSLEFAFPDDCDERLERLVQDFVAQMDEEEKSTKKDLLYIAVQTEEETSIPQTNDPQFNELLAHEQQRKVKAERMQLARRVLQSSCWGGW
jgi:hypothetical protein